MNSRPSSALPLAGLVALSLAAAPLAGQAYVGRWAGTATQPGAETGTWTVVMELGPLGGSIRFPTLECGGSLSRLRAGPSPIFGELLEYGRDRCVTGLRVRVSAVTATSLTWEEITAGGEVMAYGTLTRSSPPHRTAEVASSIRSIEAAARSPGCTGAVACNFFVGRIGELRGVPYFRDVLSDRSDDGRTANEIYGFVDRAAASPGSGWRRIDAQEAQALADQGRFVLGVARNVAEEGHGHVVVVAPGEMARADHPGSGPWVRDSQNPQVSVPASSRFGSSVVEPIWAVWVNDLPAGGR